MTLQELYNTVNRNRSPLSEEISLHDLRHNTGLYTGRPDGKKFMDNERHRELFFFRTLHVPKEQEYDLDKRFYNQESAEECY